jgi:3,5-epimerase/4-reductase
MYREYIDPEFTWENFTKEEQATILKSDRSNNALDTLKIEKEYPKLENIEQSVLKIIKSIKKNT